MDADNECDACKLDRVAWSDLSMCLCKNIGDLIDDLVGGKRHSLDALTCNDRVIYILAVIVILFTLRLLFSV